MENRKIRWGLMGVGEILNRWMKGALQIKDMEIVAVASRTKERAEKMAEKFQIPKAVSYEEMLIREDIDVVYIPVPHTAHKKLAIRAMCAGKAVLVEKPAAINVAEFDEMVSCGKRNHVFMMEAVWTRFFPIIEDVEKCLAEGSIGDVRAIQSNFSFRNEVYNRLFDINQGGWRTFRYRGL